MSTGHDILPSEASPLTPETPIGADQGVYSVPVSECPEMGKGGIPESGHELRIREEDGGDTSQETIILEEEKDSSQETVIVEDKEKKCEASLPVKEQKTPAPAMSQKKKKKVATSKVNVTSAPRRSSRLAVKAKATAAAEADPSDTDGRARIPAKEKRGGQKKCLAASIVTVIMSLLLIGVHGNKEMPSGAPHFNCELARHNTSHWHLFVLQRPLMKNQLTPKDCSSSFGLSSRTSVPLSPWLQSGQFYFKLFCGGILCAGRRPLSRVGSSSTPAKLKDARSLFRYGPSTANLWSTVAAIFLVYWTIVSSGRVPPVEPIHRREGNAAAVTISGGAACREGEEREEADEEKVRHSRLFGQNNNTFSEHPFKILSKISNWWSKVGRQASEGVMEGQGSTKEQDPDTLEERRTRSTSREPSTSSPDLIIRKKDGNLVTEKPTTSRKRAVVNRQLFAQPSSMQVGGRTDRKVQPKPNKKSDAVVDLALASTSAASTSSAADQYPHGFHGPNQVVKPADVLPAVDDFWMPDFGAPYWYLLIHGVEPLGWTKEYQNVVNKMCEMEKGVRTKYLKAKSNKKGDMERVKAGDQEKGSGCHFTSRQSEAGWI